MITSEQVLKLSPEQVFDVLNSEFGKFDWVGWDPDTLTMHLEEVDDIALDKVLAVQAVAHNSNFITNDSVAFEKVVNAFCNNVCVVDAYQPVYVEELTYAVPHIIAIIKKVHPEATVVFAGEVPGYIAAVAHYRDWIVLPNRLGFAQQLLNYLNGIYETNARYNENSALIKLISETVRDLDEDEITYDKVVGTDAIKNLPADTVNGLAFKRVLGAYLYDPTTLYK